MSGRVLIVEDEMMVALDLEAVLQDLGYETIGIASDAETALKLAQAEPDVALVDLNLRDGLTGPQIGSRLAKEMGVAVLFLTANPRILCNGVEGAIGVLDKPSEESLVKAAVEYAFRRRAGEPVAAPAELTLFAH